MTQHNTTYYKKINKQIINEIAQTKNLAKTTIYSYHTALDKYSTYHQLSIQELLAEADQEEEEGIRLKRRKIKQRLLTFRAHLQEQGKQPLTINTQMSKILSTYNFYEIETPHIPRLQNTTHELIEDIPTKKHIRTALEATGNLGLQALILFLSSSGTSRNEALSITIQDFIDATREYHHETTLPNVIRSLENKDYVVPMFQLYRKKTHYPYITFCSPEATQKIVLYLRHRLSLHGEQYGLMKFPEHIHINYEDKLFPISKETVNKNFSRLNDKLGWGNKGTRRFFHPHALRKYFATELLKHDLDSITIDFLSGRKINQTHEAYFKADPRKLKEKYMQFMSNLMIYEEVYVRDITTPELHELEYYREKIAEQDVQMRKIEQMIQKYKQLIE